MLRKVVVVPDVLTSTECEIICDYCSPKCLPSKVGSSFFSNKKIRHSMNCFITQNDTKLSNILGKVTNCLVQISADVFDFPINYIEPVQYSEYTEGMYYNEYYPGNQIAMPPQIEDDIVEFDDGTIATHNQIARDITSFLAWTAEPELERRKSLGVKTLFFLVLITIMLLGVKRKVWKHLD